MKTRPTIFTVLLVMALALSLWAATGILYVGSFQSYGGTSQFGSDGGLNLGATTLVGSGKLTASGLITGNGGGQFTGNFADALDLYGDAGGDNISIFHATGGNSVVFDTSANVTLYGGTVTGNGSGLTTLNASSLSSGTVSAALLPLATSAAFGAVKVDGTTITAASGIISVAGGTATSNALVLYANYSPGSNLLINFASPARTNVANLVFRVTATNGLVITFTNVPDGLAFAVDVNNGSALTNTVTFNQALASTNLFPVRVSTVTPLTIIATTSTNSHLLNCFLSNGTNICLASQTSFNY